MERTTRVQLLTVSQIEAAFHYNVFSADAATNQQTAIDALVNLGYSAHDAWVVLSARNHAPLPNEPA